jgi:NAD(P)-dependent dehydrogenase (short-subunit alcohol dehydrogenase family)
MRLASRVVVITGGGRGIGAATAQTIAAEGGKVVIGDMLEAEGAATAAAIRATGGDAVFVRTDVTKEADCLRLAAAAVERHGALEVVICCAGILRGAMLQAEALDEATFAGVLDVNLKGTFLTVKAALPWLRKAEQGVVLCLASEAGTKIPSSSLAYGASKGGVHGFTMTLEAQLAPHGIRVNEICPSSIATPMRIENLVDRARAAGRDPEQARAEAIKEAGDPMGVARILAFLASREADYVRGTIYTR